MMYPFRLNGMPQLSRPLLLLAHPGHEVLTFGWIARNRPLVCILTDGSGHSSASRLHTSRELLAGLGAGEGPIVGRFTDREIYSVIREGRGAVIRDLVAELRQLLAREHVDMIVADAMEGFNPVHDLCRVLAGAAAEGLDVRRYEYPVDRGPDAYDSLPHALLSKVDDAMFTRKLAAAETLLPVIPDIGNMLDRWGREAFRREALLPIGDWRARGWPDGERPLYEQIGEERVTAGRYDHVIRYREHFLPLVEAASAVASSSAP
jgi:hypothetical protein